jgi:homogentisate 1,2-dioxygenase
MSSFSGSFLFSMSRFGNEFSTESMTGALLPGCNSPQQCITRRPHLNHALQPC